jgi:ATP-dependent DNA helicase PIF1
LGTAWFQQANKITFTKNYRSNDPQYAAMLENIGDGMINTIDIPDSSIAASIEDLIDNVYGDDVTSDDNSANMILAYTLEQCANVNGAVFNRIASAGATVSLAADDLSSCRNPDEYPAEYVASLHVHGAPPAELQLKIKARYMILRNIDPPNVCNGVLAECVTSSRILCTMKLLTGPGKGTLIKLPRVSFVVTSEQSGLPFSFGRRQFPIAPAYCVTVHKSQGQTLNKIGVIAETDAFAHGQVYVSMSRVGSWDKLMFFSPRVERFIKNKVARRLIAAMQRMQEM